MAMSYDTLVAGKSAAGSIINWVGHNKLDVLTVIDEAQSLLYTMLRVREMRTQWVFGIPVGGCKVALPARFLDPIGKLSDNVGQRYFHRTESTIVDGRSFDSAAGSFGNNPFTTGAIGSSLVTAHLVGHSLNQGSDITIAQATTVDGVVINGTSLVTSVTDADNLVFEVQDAAATAGNVTGGGAAATYTANNLVSGAPNKWAIWDECLQFDGAFDTATQFRLMCFKSKPLLSATNQTNFLTDRYPGLVRVACLAAGASYMKDDGEYTKHVAGLQGMIQGIAMENDLEYRGADLDTETP